MLIDVASDIHTDLWAGGVNSINWASIRNAGSDVLLLSGDTSNYIHEVEAVIHQTAAIYNHIIFTDGNHEHYFCDSSVHALENYFDSFAKKYQNVTYLHGKNSVQIDNTVFIGCNGWYDFQVGFPRWTKEQAKSAWYKMSNDPKMINFIDAPVEMMAKAHAEMLVSHVTKLQESDVDVVVCTHTIPHPNFSEWSIYENTPAAVLDGAYYNTQMKNVFDADANQKIKLWLFGHTHQRFDRQIGHIRYLNNSRGYQCEENKSSKWFLVQVDTQDKRYG